MSDTNPTKREPFADSASTARFLGVSVRTLRRYVSEGFLVGYALPGKRGLRFRLSEVQAAMKAIPAARASAGYGSFGPKARIVTLDTAPREPIMGTIPGAEA